MIQISFRKLISLLYRMGRIKKDPPHAHTWGEPEQLAVPPNFGANTPSYACNGAAPSKPTAGFSSAAPKRTSPELRAGAFTADGAPSLPVKKQVTFLFHRV